MRSLSLLPLMMMLLPLLSLIEAAPAPPDKKIAPAPSKCTYDYYPGWCPGTHPDCICTKKLPCGSTMPRPKKDVAQNCYEALGGICTSVVSCNTTGADKKFCGRALWDLKKTGTADNQCTARGVEVATLIPIGDHSFGYTCLASYSYNYAIIQVYTRNGDKGSVNQFATSNLWNAGQGAVPERSVYHQTVPARKPEDQVNDVVPVLQTYKNQNVIMTYWISVEGSWPPHPAANLEFITWMIGNASALLKDQNIVKRIGVKTNKDDWNTITGKGFLKMKDVPLLYAATTGSAMDWGGADTPFGYDSKTLNGFVPKVKHFGTKKLCTMMIHELATWNVENDA